MADEVVRPQDILEGDLRDRLKKAVVAAYMATSVIDDASGHSIKRFVNMEAEGDSIRFNYEASIIGENYPVYCTYPSGDWNLNVRFGPDLGDYPGFTAINVGGAWEDLEAQVDSWLDPWLECPNPNAFQNQINSVARIASQLNIGGGDASGGPPGGDTDLREAVKTISNRAFGRSNALVAFRDAYASDLWTTINNQCGMASAAGLAMTAEGAAWSETYRTLRDLIQVAIGDFNSLAGSQGSGDGAALAATSAVAGLLGATAGVAFPPFGVAMGGLSAVIGVYTVMYPAVPAVDTSALRLTGGDYYAMWESFVEEVRRVSTDLAKAEEAVADGCRRVVADTVAHPESYSLSRSTSKGKQYDDFGAALVEEIDLPKNLLREMSGAAELIGDQQTQLAGFVVGNDATGTAPSSTVRDEWYRGALPDGSRIGMDAGYGDGPFEAYSDHIDALAELLRTEGGNSHRMAEALMLTALDFDRTDELSAEESRRVQRQIDASASSMDHNPLYAGNDPNDPWHQQYAN
ncbi:MAG: hypothetical protein Q8O61_08605 [Nocardioides sp.]|nr:hypothetical protein [Nocardioides sp.]